MWKIRYTRFDGTERDFAQAYHSYQEANRAAALWLECGTVAGYTIYQEPQPVDDLTPEAAENVRRLLRQVEVTL